MPKFPKPWFRKKRGWYVTLDGQQMPLGTEREAAFERYHDLMRQPREQKASAAAVVSIIDQFLDWVQKNRATETYAWYQSRLQLFATKYPDLLTKELKPIHVQQWIDGFSHLSSGSRRNYARAIVRCMNWAEEQGLIERSPVARFKKPKAGVRQTIITPEEYAAILNLIPNDVFRDLLTFAWESRTQLAATTAFWQPPWSSTKSYFISACPFHLEPPLVVRRNMKFTVTITRTSVASMDVEIDDANIVTSKQAVRKALDEAGDQDFTNCVVEYQFGCDGVSPDDGTWDNADQDPDDFDDDPADQMMQVAEDMVRGTGEEPSPTRTDEPLPGFSDDASGKANEIGSHGDEKCAICDASIMPDDLNAAIDAGWLPSYFIGDEEQSGPVCPRCDEQFIVRDEGGEGVLHVEGEYVSVWDGRTEVVSPCTVDPRTREVHIRHSEDRLAPQSLDREYVRLNGKEYAACHEDDWADYTAEERSQMLWWK